jgi:hypothetical protein
VAVDEKHNLLKCPGRLKVVRIMLHGNRMTSQQFWGGVDDLIETVYKLLVVDDDDEEVLGHIVEYFTRAGLEVIGVLDGKTALDTMTRDTLIY